LPPSMRDVAPPPIKPATGLKGDEVDPIDKWFLMGIDSA